MKKMEYLGEKTDEDEKKMADEGKMRGESGEWWERRIN